MSFRAYQKMRCPNCWDIPREVKKVAKNGVVTTETISNSDFQEKLPDPSMYDLAESLNAGVNLEQVSTKIIK